MRQYTLRAHVVPNPAAHQDLARGFAGTTHALTAYACCLIEPSYQQYFPAVIYRDEEFSPRPGVHVVMTIALTDGEAEKCFVPGQRFTIWSDAVVGRTVRADGLVGYGVISRPRARAA
ncbi:MAG TPA: hypothetical protein VEC76_13885 [Streptosporangiaceae bacterium]|nr:hypothetical protein [Streptosporangiaceae bacterium]